MAKLKLTLFHTKSVANAAASVFKKQVEKGNAFLRPYGMQYEVYPANGSLELDWDVPLSANGRVDPGLSERLRLRDLANSKYYSTDNRLPVILCQIAGGGGEAPGSIAQKLNWLPWVIMDASTLNEDGLTLTHEAGHCAGLMHPGTPPMAEPRLVQMGEAVTDNIMAYGTFDIGAQKFGARSLVEVWQVEAFRRAYFYSP